MKLLTVFTAALLCAKIIPAEEKGKVEAASIPTTKQETRSVRAKDLASSNPSFSVMDTWASFTVQPGGTLKLTSTNDYTGAEHVSVAIECPSGNSLQNISLVVYWGNSLAPYLAATDVIASGSFAFRNAGCAVVPVYGPQLLVQVSNTSAIPVTCDQVTTYAVVH